MFENLSEYIKNVISNRVFPGCFIGVVSERNIWSSGFGNSTYDNKSAEVTNTTIYDVASITKAIPLALLAYIAIEKKIFSVDDKVVAIIPEYKGNYREEVTVKHLLTHTLDFGFRMSEFAFSTADCLINKILNAQLRAFPGETFSYANATSILLGMVIERVFGASIDTIAEKYIFNKIGMKNTTFHPKRSFNTLIAPTEVNLDTGEALCGIIHDESARKMYPRIVGSAGLFSSGEDIVKCVKMIIQKGIAEEKRVLTEETITLMHKNALKKTCNSKAALGWELDQPFMGKKRSQKTFGKTGFTGCSVIIDSCRNVGIVLLSNHVHPKRLPDRTIINNVRADVADMVFTAIDGEV